MTSRYLFSIAILFAVSPLHAATLHLTMEYVGSVDNSFSPIGLPLLDNPLSVSPSDYHGFAVYYQLLDAASDEDFHAMQFDVNLGPGFTPADFGGWIADTTIFDPPGPLPPTTIYTDNIDGGVNSNDLKRIIVIAKSYSQIPQREPGEGAPEKAGDVYLQWNGTFGPGGITSIGLAPNGLNPWSVYVDDVPTAQPAATFTVGPDFVMTIPEPATFALAGLAAVGLVGCIRRRS
jgi:hypothetical protein